MPMYYLVTFFLCLFLVHAQAQQKNPHLRGMSSKAAESKSTSTFHIQLQASSPKPTSTARPSRNPTTVRPSRNPATARPSRNPATARPSRNPTTAKPSRTYPTISPSSLPSSLPVAPLAVSSSSPTSKPSYSPILSPSPDFEPPSLKGITALHNTARAGVFPPAIPALGNMTWDASATTDAQSWADTCTWAHGGSGLHTLYGQNLYASTGTTVVTTNVVGSWVGENVAYSYDTNTCATGKVCGHYTQVVWRASLGLGCGVKTCTINSPWGSTYPTWTIVVCNYAPPGNYVGSKPY